MQTAPFCRSASLAITWFSKAVYSIYGSEFGRTRAGEGGGEIGVEKESKLPDQFSAICSSLVKKNGV